MENFDDNFRKQTRRGESHPRDDPFDKEAFVARKKQERDAVYALIDETATKMAADGKTFQAYLDVQSRFDRYSVSNAILVCAQMPEATKLADFDTWKNSDVFIQRHAQAITILEPGKAYTREADGSAGVFYNPKKVFDISQTTSLQKAPASIRLDRRLLLKALISHAPCRFAVSEDLPENRNALYQREQNTIFARSGVDGDACFQSVSQELALACMEHSGKGLAAPAFAAYCVSYMVCKRHGVDVDRSGFDHLPEVYQAMGPKTFRAELGAIKEISGDRIIEMRRFLDAQEKAHRHRDDGAR
jgi:hypothetical protein